MAPQALLHHALLLLFLLMVLWPFSGFSIWFTAAQEQQAMHVGKIRTNQSDIVEKRNYGKLIPVPEIKYLPWALESDKKRRKLAPFQLCSGCTCCAGESNNRVCTTSACCYSITCGLPDKPYGVCAFTPKACTCTNCTGV
ncbi:hypothetical protein SUGI_0751210 [Cryptomeria japonica]|uniref:uncharacterized protein LOC131036325 n=1 Tax=Cryptomeria japonica TaxID=3369 RepID=UPI002414CE0F|nr:uncharacterized protein LOC131036325 [Cryptomeria japonica]GLJ37073.1 hypothetical protein SUGI_0751210 [Cryptomeria japonica]